MCVENIESRDGRGEREGGMGVCVSMKERESRGWGRESRRWEREWERERDRSGGIVCDRSRE